MPIFKKEIEFKLKDIEAGHFKVTYKGIPAVKCPFDYVLYQMLIWEVQPDIIVEIGTYKGGSTLYLADLLELNGKGIVHTIDLPVNEESSLIHNHEKIRVFKNGFKNYDVSPLRNAGTVMVIEDGSHLYEDSLEALQIFSPFVSNGSYYIAEDGIVNELGKEKEFHGGPQKAVSEFLKNNGHFKIERKWCDFFGTNATFNVNGYLRRVN